MYSFGIGIHPRARCLGLVGMVMYFILSTVLKFPIQDNDHGPHSWDLGSLWWYLAKPPF